MTHISEKHRRKNIRLEGYDYSRPGAYFVTVCTHNRQCLFGNITDGKMVLNEAGKMILKWTNELENKFPDIKCDNFICMPNHVHFIIINVGADLRVCPKHNTVTSVSSKGEHTGSPLPRIVQWFKTMTTNNYIKHVKNNLYPPFQKQLWQRNYYEHIIRNDHELNRIREYILFNPEQWDMDRENPANIKIPRPPPPSPPILAGQGVAGDEI